MRSGDDFDLPDIFYVSRFSDTRIVKSWKRNASPWTTAVRRGEILSRKLVTDRAIVDAIRDSSPGTVLDLGCGEGWLARELAKYSIHVTGIDAVPELIEVAQRAGGGDFRVMTYNEIAAGALTMTFDLIVCNFSLLGNESVEGVCRAARRLLDRNGSFVVQTLHPIAACGVFPYQDGWREGSWDGFSANFVDPAPWYFRTMEGWNALFQRSGLTLVETREPIHPHTQQPASVIFIVQGQSGTS